MFKLLNFVKCINKKDLNVVIGKIKSNITDNGNIVGYEVVSTNNEHYNLLFSDYEITF